MFFKCQDCGAPQSISNEEICSYCGNIFRKIDFKLDLTEITKSNNSELIYRRSYLDAVINFNNKKYKTALTDFWILSQSFPEEVILLRYISECEYFIGDYKNIHQYFYFQTQIHNNETHLLEILNQIDEKAYSSHEYANKLVECLFLLLEYNSRVFFEYLENESVPNNTNYTIVHKFLSIISNYSNYSPTNNLEQLFDWYIQKKLDLNSYWIGSLRNLNPHLHNTILNTLKVINKTNSQNSKLFFNDFIHFIMNNSQNILEVIIEIQSKNKIFYRELNQSVRKMINDAIYQDLIKNHTPSIIKKELNIESDFDVFNINRNQITELKRKIYSLSSQLYISKKEFDEKRDQIIKYIFYIIVIGVIVYYYYK